MNEYLWEYLRDICKPPINKSRQLIPGLLANFVVGAGVSHQLHEVWIPADICM